MGHSNRRRSFRIPLQIALNEYTSDRANRCLTNNISASGLYLNRLLQPEERKRPVIGLEFELPGTSEIIWAKGEIRFHAMDEYFHGTGVQFSGMARFHKRLIRDYVFEQREKQLRKLLATIHRNRLH